MDSKKREPPGSGPKPVFSNREPDPWAQGTGPKGLLGVLWIYGVPVVGIILAFSGPFFLFEGALGGFIDSGDVLPGGDSQFVIGFGICFLAVLVATVLLGRGRAHSGCLVLGIMLGSPLMLFGLCAGLF